jgi:hypothetical protein
MLNMLTGGREEEWHEFQIVWESAEHDVRHVTSIRVAHSTLVSQLCHHIVIAAAEASPASGAGLGADVCWRMRTYADIC